MNNTAAIWFPIVRTGTGTDVFTERLVAELRKYGVRAEITWLPLRAEYAPWTVPVPPVPEWASVAHVNSWLHSRFIPKSLPIIATIHHAVHHPDAQAYKGYIRAAYHRYWIAPNERRVLSKAKKAIAVSQFVADATKETLLNRDMQVIYNGVDVEVFKPGNRLRQENENFRLLYVGSWMARKGVDLLAPIMRELGEGFELRYTGGAAAMHAKPDMPVNMHDIGRLQGDAAVVSAMQEVDALLFPSRSEGFGLVAAEAMACGLPVIAFRETCLEEILEDGVTGRLLPLGDICAVAEAVRAMAKNRASLQRMSIAARRHVVSKFGLPAMLDAYLNTYLVYSRKSGSSNECH